MPAKTTAKDFFLWAGAMVALYWGVVAFIFLLFDYINYALPNVLQYQGDPYQTSIPYDMASLVVLLPIYLLIVRFIRRDIVADPSRQEIWVRRWLLILTLFISGVTVAIDLVVLLTAFFRGEELTMAFLLKVLIVLLVAATIFMHFIADLWGYWRQYPMRAMYVGIALCVLIVAAIVSGFFIVGTPQQARLARFDDQKVNDLQSIQYRIAEYYQAKQHLPQSLNDLSDDINGYRAPIDAQSNQPYEYRATGALSFELCATFNGPSRIGPQGDASPLNAAVPGGYYGVAGQDTWLHGGGRACFSHSIDPSYYPPSKLPTPTAR